MFNNSILSLQKRLLSVFMLVTFIFIAIIVRLGYIQLVQGQWLQARAASQWTRDLPINAKRGAVLDRNGASVAESFSTYDVYVRASMIKSPTKVALILSDNLSITYENAFKKATNTNVSESLIKLQVSDEAAKKIIKQNEPGIMLSENNKRFYPYGDLLTQVLGFTTIDNVGQAGLEVFYETYLKGVRGYALEESDVHGVKLDNTLSTYIPSIDGLNVNLTIDVNIQKVCESALTQLMIDYKPKTATAIVMNPNTGEILGMSTKPSFNLNEPPRDNVAELLQSVKNISVVDVYEPGSTFKLLTTATALDAKVTTPEEKFYDPGYRIVDGEKIKCWKLTGHGSQSMTEGLCNSCNSVFVDLALRLGKDKMYESFKMYGLGSKLGLDFMGEASGILMKKENAKKVDLARMGFGQAIAVSPIQLINAVCSVVNGGNLMKPYFVKNVTDNNGKIVKETRPSVINKTVSEQTSKQITAMMEQVIKQYSGINTFIPGYRISGKTGTSQKYENGKIVQKYIASFVGAYPANKPEYVVLIVADEPSGGNYFGSVVATPYAKLIFEDIIRYKQDEPNNLEQDQALLVKNIEIPNLIGKSLTEALSVLAGLGLQVEITGEGGLVLNQTPPPKTMVFKNSIVLIET